MSHDDRIDPRDVPAVWRPPAFLTCAVVLGVVLALALAEVGLRVFAALTDTSGVAQLGRTRESYPPPAGTDCHSQEDQARLGELIRPSPEPAVVYVLKPDLDTCFKGARVRTNAEGQRGPTRYARPKPPGVYRILLLGDSQAFGWGVPDDATLGALVADSLSTETGREVEVINTAVPGYNTTQEAAALESFGMDYDPDCVVVLFIANDFQLPTFLLGPRDVLATDRSYLVRSLRLFWNRDRIHQQIQGFQPVEGPLGEYAPEQVPVEYRRTRGLPGYRRALERMRELTREIPLVNIADYGPTGQDEALLRMNSELGISHPAFEFPTDAEWRISDADGHLNVAGTAELARRVLVGLAETSVCHPGAVIQ